tara:strand:+ start:398 stop:817 length:420 start_codon:yes stop_codon:yes gene_type:complete
MPKNTKGGSKHKKQKNVNINNDENYILKDSDEQDYGKVIKLLGNCRVRLLCNDKIERIGLIRGSMKKKQWVNLDNIVLYSKREYENDKVDIIFVYNNIVIKNIQHLLNLNFIIDEQNEIDDLFIDNNEIELDNIDFDLI